MLFMPLDVQRLLDSDLFVTATGDEFKAAVALWCKSWSQVPAASLPDDDRILADYSRAGARWKKVRDIALSGWSKANDGRLYHAVVAEKAREAWTARIAQRARTEAARAAREAARAASDRARGVGSTHHATTSVTESVTDNVTASKGQGQGQGQGQYPPPSPADVEPDHAAPPPVDPAAAAAALRKPINGVNLDRVRAAILAEDPTALLAAYGANTERTEWPRDLDGLQIGTLAAILARRRHTRQSIREPSGLRQAREAWAALTREERKVWCSDMLALAQEGPAA
jgi:hypothetical protein